jgi:type 2A phosphatase activator TIP41
MPTSFLLLQRFFLRVEGTLFRVRDTRVFHEFGTGQIVREYVEHEVPFEKLRFHPDAVADTMKLMDVNWVAAQMPPCPLHVKTEVFNINDINRN